MLSTRPGWRGRAGQALMPWGIVYVSCNWPHARMRVLVEGLRTKAAGDEHVSTLHVSPLHCLKARHTHAVVPRLRRAAQHWLAEPDPLLKPAGDRPAETWERGEMNPQISPASPATHPRPLPGGTGFAPCPAAQIHAHRGSARLLHALAH